MARSFSESEELLRFARAYCAEHLPWFAPALFQCRLHLSERVPVAGIDRHLNIYFNPSVVQRLQRTAASRDELLPWLGFLWVHEISHLLREHAGRGEQLKAAPLIWNVAADLEINDSQWPGLAPAPSLPGVFPQAFGWPTGQLAEWYHQQLDRHWARHLIMLQQTLASARPDEWLDEGSGIHGQLRPWEMDENSPRQQLDHLSLTVIRRQVAREMQRHAQAGAWPAGWDRWIKEMLQPRVDWRHLLRHRLSVALQQGRGRRVDYSFQRLSRRQTVYHPILSPSLGGDQSARLAVVLDTSGSINPPLLAKSVGEVLGLLRSFQVPVTLIPCDTVAYERLTLRTTADLRRLTVLPGGGGTDLQSGIEAALELRPAPDTILVLTDGYTPYPTRPAAVPIIFGIFQPDPGQPIPRPPNPPWGEDAVVVIEV
ncbi:MAG: hypothetical protein KDC54_23950 [Lewinella sp.]|nr:hypothetical protein [Lewinella sp.]